MSPLFQHRHYVAIAYIIATLPEDMRNTVALTFTKELRGTNPQFDTGRFFEAAMGNPNGRDKRR